MFVIDQVREDRLEVHPAGWSLTATCGDAIARRFDELASCGLDLRVDLSMVGALDPEIAEVFSRAAARLKEFGATLEVTGADGRVSAILGLPSTAEETSVVVMSIDRSNPLADHESSKTADPAR